MRGQDTGMKKPHDEATYKDSEHLSLRRHIKIFSIEEHVILIGHRRPCRPLFWKLLRHIYRKITSFAITCMFKDRMLAIALQDCHHSQATRKHKRYLTDREGAYLMFPIC